MSTNRKRSLDYGKNRVNMTEKRNLLNVSTDSDLITLNSPTAPLKRRLFAASRQNVVEFNRLEETGSPEDATGHQRSMLHVPTPASDLIDFIGSPIVVYEACGTSSNAVGNIPSRENSKSSQDSDSDGYLGLGIIDIEEPKCLSAVDQESICDEFFPSIPEVSLSDEEAGLGAEDYYASLFARCDPENSGVVKVSVLLNTIRELQALAVESDDHNLSGLSGSSYTQELVQLKEVIDPNNEDPNISLPTFTKGITSYLENKKWSCLSPIKCSSMMEDGGTHDHDEMCSWQRKGGRFAGGDRCSSFLNLSRISSSNNNISLEALAGTSSNLHENGEVDWRAEISDLHLQVQKLNDDNNLLKGRVTVAQDENFCLLQTQRDELDKKDVDLKHLTDKLKKLEREVSDKNLQISGLEDRTTVLSNRNSRLENECSAYQKERKELVLECEELKIECKKTLRIVRTRDEEISRARMALDGIQRESQEKEKWLNDRNEMLAQSVEHLSQKVEKLEVEKSDLKSKLRVETGKGNPTHHHRVQSPPLLYQVSHQDSFDMDVTSEDIQTELLVAEGCFVSVESIPMCTPRFDVGTQCTHPDDSQVDKVEVEILYALASEISKMLCSIHNLTFSSSSTGNGDDELCKVDQIPNGSGGVNGSGVAATVESLIKRRTKKNKGDQSQDAAPQDGDQLSESNATVVVRQINQELAEFREQLKKSQELFAVLRYNSTQSISLTKSCPGLSLDPSDPALNKSCSSSNANSKAVSCGTQTDSPVIETPILAQKLCLGSSVHHHNLMMSGPCGLADYMTSDSMDNPSFDKLSDDGSVRVRDDLSMVLEVSEQETETSPGTGRRAMSFDKGSSRRKLTRMANATEEELHSSHTNSNNHSHNHYSSNRVSVANSCSSNHSHLEEGITSDNDNYVSATSSQAESVYLSLERPLKVTVSNKDDRSSGGGTGNYRSCASSMSGSLRGCRIPGSGSINSALAAAAQDCDTASLLSEGNTTFGSPLSSPSSPYWTPSQGSSSQETITPLDGDRTPVNEEEINHYHLNDISPGTSGYHKLPFMSSPSPSEPSDLKKGVIPENKMIKMMQLAHDGVMRGTDPDANILDIPDWHQLRHDTDLSDKELYRKTVAQEDGNEDDGGRVGVEGAAQTSHSAFAQDEEAEKYLYKLPDIAKNLFQLLDTMPDKKQAPTNEDMKDLERKFNHLAEVFQTDHTNLDQRVEILGKNFKESQKNLTEISQSLKSSVSKLKELSKSNSPVPEDFVDVIKTLNSTSDEFDLYSSSMSRDARRMGMMDVQSRLHKMLDVMILYVHIIRTKYDNLKSDFDSLHGEYVGATKLLQEKGIPFSANPAIDSLQNNNNNDEKWQWDEQELENSQSDRCEDGDSESDYRLQHLLGPKKSTVGLIRKERRILKEKRTTDNLLVRYAADGYEIIKRELFWPWSWEQTIKGLKQGFSAILMIFGLFVFVLGFLPSVSGVDGCMTTNLSYFKSIGAYFSYCGLLSHEDPPVI